MYIVIVNYVVCVAFPGDMFSRYILALSAPLPSEELGFGDRTECVGRAHEDHTALAQYAPTSHPASVHD